MYITHSSSFFLIGPTGALPLYTDIDAELLKLCEDAILNKHDNATEAMLERAELEKQQGPGGACSRAYMRVGGLLFSRLSVHCSAF